MNARALLADIRRDLEALEKAEPRPGRRAFIRARRVQIEEFLA